LNEQGKVEEAIAEFQKALRLRKDFAPAHNGLGTALSKQGKLDEAIAAYKEATRLKPDLAEAHCNLGIALGRGGRLDEAVAAFHEAIRLKPGFADAYHDLGIALQLLGRLDEAVVAFKEALRLKPDDANNRTDLDTTREFIELDTRLAKVLSGERQPDNAAERTKLALLCAQPFKQLPATAARFYAEAFASEPKLAEDLPAGHRYNAACAAALAAAGQGRDAQDLDAPARARWRRQALEWLRADLVQWTRQLETGSPQSRVVLRRTLEHWQLDSDLASVRGEPALARLAAEEQPGWRQLWADVETILARARQEKSRQEKSAKKQ
jgi:Tfp pilus assembly protein PilF